MPHKMHLSARLCAINLKRASDSIRAQLPVPLFSLIPLRAPLISYTVPKNDLNAVL